MPAVIREVFGRLSGGKVTLLGIFPPISSMNLKTKGEKRKKLVRSSDDHVCSKMLACTCDDVGEGKKAAQCLDTEWLLSNLDANSYLFYLCGPNISVDAQKRKNIGECVMCGVCTRCGVQVMAATYCAGPLLLAVTLVLCRLGPARADGGEACETLPSELHITKGTCSRLYLLALQHPRSPTLSETKMEPSLVGDVRESIVPCLNREIPEKTHRPAASPDMIPTLEKPGVTPPGMEPGSPWWQASTLAGLWRGEEDGTSCVPLTMCVAEEFDELGRLQRTCNGDVEVSKCEGACNSQVQPSVITPTGFLKSSVSATVQSCIHQGLQELQDTLITAFLGLDYHGSDRGNGRLPCLPANLYEEGMGKKSAYTPQEKTRLEINAQLHVINEVEEKISTRTEEWVGIVPHVAVRDGVRSMVQAGELTSQQSRHGATSLLHHFALPPAASLQLFTFSRLTVRVFGAASESRLKPYLNRHRERPECYCCRESFLRERTITLTHCYNPDGVRLTNDQATLEIKLREPADCKCFKCGDFSR
ncbi:hypothetical protein PR048_002937 [Dryococelus australis]|uniref:Uncharacterized protein n=1 Tax=Dryococelus australis TaxID=614101 RepID=A0ABQ9ILK5_9NEOP|nr:hypothetical protein PR048_002937 [Dryococelus australis]